MRIGIRRRLRNARGFYALNGIDRWLARRLDYRDGFFVELGANDGLQQSNTAYFEKRRGWRGVLIEPAMNRFIECRKNRAPENSFFHAACVAADHAGEVVWLDYADLMTVGETSGRDREAHVRSALRHMSRDEVPFRFAAPARTLSSILEEARAPTRMDLLSLDVEGAELEVLRGLDHARWRFRNIVVEALDLEAVRPDLEGAGYALLEKITAHDYFFAER